MYVLLDMFSKSHVSDNAMTSHVSDFDFDIVNLEWHIIFWKLLFYRSTSSYLVSSTIMCNRCWQKYVNQNLNTTSVQKTFVTSTLFSVSVLQKSLLNRICMFHFQADFRIEYRDWKLRKNKLKITGLQASLGKQQT